ncbi:MAG: hypothetical protein R3Y26_00370 [Rikenellaceae bacterium]
MSNKKICPICSKALENNTFLCDGCGWEIKVFPSSVPNAIQLHENARLASAKKAWENQKKLEATINNNIEQYERVSEDNRKNQDKVSQLSNELNQRLKEIGILNTTITGKDLELNNKSALIEKLNAQLREMPSQTAGMLMVLFDYDNMQVFDLKNGRNVFGSENTNIPNNSNTVWAGQNIPNTTFTITVSIETTRSGKQKKVAKISECSSAIRVNGDTVRGTQTLGFIDVISCNGNKLIYLG